MNKYPSKYSNGKTVTAAQFITEIICERLARKNKKDLHYRFWVSAEWEKQYKGQIGAANKLLAKYDAKDIIDALGSRDGLRIYSLRAPHLGSIIEQHIKSKPKTVIQPKIIDRNLLSKGIQSNSKKPKNILDILKDIDDGSN